MLLKKGFLLTAIHCAGDLSAWSEVVVVADMQSVGFVCAAYASRLHELRRTGHLTDRRNDRVSIPSEAFVEGELAQIHHAILRQAPAEGIRRQVAASVPGLHAAVDPLFPFKFELNLCLMRVKVTNPPQRSRP